MQLQMQLLLDQQDSFISSSQQHETPSIHKVAANMIQYTVDCSYAWAHNPMLVVMIVHHDAQGLPNNTERYPKDHIPNKRLFQLQLQPFRDEYHGDLQEIGHPDLG